MSRCLGTTNLHGATTCSFKDAFSVELKIILHLLPLNLPQQLRPPPRCLIVTSHFLFNSLLLFSNPLHPLPGGFLLFCGFLLPLALPHLLCLGPFHFKAFPYLLFCPFMAHACMGTELIPDQFFPAPRGLRKEDWTHQICTPWL